MFSVALLLLAAPALQDTVADSAAIALLLPDRSVFQAGEAVAGGVQVLRDGYLLVLTSDGDGELHVLFPKRPADGQAVHADHTYWFGEADGTSEMRVVPGRQGTAVPFEQVVAVWSPHSFTTGEFERYSFWSTDELGKWRTSPMALALHLAGSAPVALASAALMIVPAQPAGSAPGGGAYDAAQALRQALPRGSRYGAPRSGVPPAVCSGGVCRYSAMQLIDLMPH